MHDIIEHYGKVIVALAGVIAALLLTTTIVGMVTNKTTKAVNGLEYENKIETSFDNNNHIK